MRKNKTREEFEKEFKETAKGEYSLYEQYKNSTTKLAIRHNICGKIYFVSPNNWLAGKRCPYCANNKKKNFSEAYNEIKKHNPDYELVGVFNGMMSEAKIRHKTCGTTFLATPNSIINHKRVCPHCKQMKKPTKENFQDLLNQKYNKEFLVIDSFESVNKPVKIYHTVCQNAFVEKPKNLLSTTSSVECPYCKEINKFLKLIEPLKTQYKVEVYPRDLLIYIPKISLMIKYCGETSYKIIFNKETYNEVKTDRNTLREFCQDRERKLLEIPFWEDFDEIIKKVITEITPLTTMTTFKKWKESLHMTSYAYYKKNKKHC